MNKTSMQASLSFVGEEFNTEYVTFILNQKPDRVRQKGEPIIIGRMTIIRSPEFDQTVWSIKIPEAESLDTDTHLEPIFDFIEKNLEKMQTLKTKFDAKWHVDVGIFIRDGHSPGIVLTSRQSSLLSAVEADIGFDMYVY